MQVAGQFKLMYLSSQELFTKVAYNEEVFTFYSHVVMAEYFTIACGCMNVLTWDRLSVDAWDIDRVKWDASVTYTLNTGVESNVYLVVAEARYRLWTIKTKHVLF